MKPNFPWTQGIMRKCPNNEGCIKMRCYFQTPKVGAVQKNLESHKLCTVSCNSTKLLQRSEKECHVPHLSCSLSCLILPRRHWSMSTWTLGNYTPKDHLLAGQIFFLLLNYLNSLYVLDLGGTGTVDCSRDLMGTNHMPYHWGAPQHLYSWYYPLARCIVFKCFIPYCKLSLHSVYCFPVQKLFSLMQSHLSV
jgi:hypothetical protein